MNSTVGTFTPEGTFEPPLIPTWTNSGPVDMGPRVELYAYRAVSGQTITGQRRKLTFLPGKPSHANEGDQTALVNACHRVLSAV